MTREDYLNYTFGSRSYRYYFQHGTEAEPTCGEARGFDDEWAALQYMDENREHAQKASDETGEAGLIQVLDMQRFGQERIIAREVLEPSRQRYTEAHAERRKLGDLIVSTAHGLRKRGAR